MSEQPDALGMANLTFTDEPVLDMPPPASPDDVKVPRTYRLPVELDQWITETAKAIGTSLDPPRLRAIAPSGANVAVTIGGPGRDPDVGQ